MAQKNFNITETEIQVIAELAKAMTVATGEKPNFSAALRKIVREWKQAREYREAAAIQRTLEAMPYPDAAAE